MILGTRVSIPESIKNQLQINADLKFECRNEYSILNKIDFNLIARFQILRNKTKLTKPRFISI
jgi:hypothetical protein